MAAMCCNSKSEAKWYGMVKNIYIAHQLPDFLGPGCTSALTTIKKYD